jgi:hypothetical protein
MEERRKGDRRQLYGKPFLAMLMGGLPEDRRKGERRRDAAATGAATATMERPATGPEGRAAAD